MEPRIDKDDVLGDVAQFCYTDSVKRPQFLVGTTHHEPKQVVDDSISFSFVSVNIHHSANTLDPRSTSPWRDTRLLRPETHAFRFTRRPNWRI